MDDRIDTVTIKSDYWIGKQFTITQKGTARLIINHENDTIINSSIGQKTFTVNSNQDWSCKVTEGSEWLSIVSGSTGTIDGDVTVETTENKGESRTGIVTVLDRHQVPVATVTYYQEGVLLVPEKEEYRESYKNHDIFIDVESNTDWTLEKGSEYDIWYQIETGTSYNGNATIKIHLDVNGGVSLRKTEIVLKTVSNDENVSPVVKRVIIKQGPTPQPDRTEMDQGFLGSSIYNGAPTFENGDMICVGGKNRVSLYLEKLGTHTFRIKEMDLGSSPVFYILVGDYEFRYHINTSASMTDISGNTAFGDVTINNVPLDITIGHSLSILVSEEDGKLKFELALDGVDIGSTITPIPSGSELWVLLGSNDGNCIWDYYEYSPLVEWDN